jgi:hypothetical protein
MSSHPEVLVAQPGPPIASLWKHLSSFHSFQNESESLCCPMRTGPFCAGVKALPCKCFGVWSLHLLFCSMKQTLVLSSLTFSSPEPCRVLLTSESSGQPRPHLNLPFLDYIVFISFSFSPLIHPVPWPHLSLSSDVSPVGMFHSNVPTSGYSFLSVLFYHPGALSITVLFLSQCHSTSYYSVDLKYPLKGPCVKDLVTSL